jgi:adenylate cyclase
MSGDPEQEYFADGVVEDIITALSRVRWLFVIARNSSFTYKGRAVDVKHVGKELGVRYVLEGSVRRAGRKLRITGQLIEAATGHHVWTDRFDGEAEDVFALQDEITQHVVSAIEPSLRLIEIERARTKPTYNLDAYDIYLRSLPEFHSLTEQGFRSAERLLREALRRDPKFADAWAALADCLTHMTIHSLVEGAEAAAKEACQAALRGVEVDPENGPVLAVAAWTVGMLGGRHDQSVELAQRALRLHPNSAFVRTWSAWAFIFTGDQDEALIHFEAARRMNPIDPRGYSFLVGFAAAHFFKKNFEEVLVWTGRALERNGNAVVALRYRAAAFVHLGFMKEGKEAVRRLLQLDPTYTLSRAQVFRYRHQWMADLLRLALRDAGLPE